MQVADLAHRGLGLCKQLRRRGLERLCNADKALVHLVGQLEACLAGHRLDAAHAGGDRRLAHDAERADLRRVVQMCAAAKLHRNGFFGIAHRDHADNIAVFFAEQRRRAALFRLLNGQLLRHDGIAVENELGHHAADSCQLLGLDGLEVREVKAQAIRLDQ